MNIQNIVLLDGSEIISEVIDDTPSSITLIDPMVYITTSDGETSGSVLDRFIPMAKDHVVLLPESSILAICEPNEYVVRYYNATIAYNESGRDEYRLKGLKRAVAYLESRDEINESKSDLISMPVLGGIQ